jgi:hypothetical protein
MRKTPEALFTTLHFLRNLQMGPISKSVGKRAGKACQGQTVAYLVLLMLQRKISAVRKTPGAVFTTHHFLRKLQIVTIS